MNELCGAMTGIEPVFTSIYDDMQTTTYGTNMEVTMRDEFTADYSKANGSARGDIIYTIPRDMDLYVSCRGTNVNKVALLIDGNEVAYDRYQGQLFHVGEMKTGQTVDIQFVLNDGQDQSGDLYCYPMEFDREQFQQVYETLAAQSMQVASYETGKIEGTIKAEKDGMMMTSIPYDEGWKVYVDGEEVDTWIMLDGFLGTEMEKGEHVVQMVYHCPGTTKGAVITLFGIVGVIFVIRFEKKKRKTKGCEEEAEEEKSEKGDSEKEESEKEEPGKKRSRKKQSGEKTVTGSEQEKR